MAEAVQCGVAQAWDAAAEIVAAFYGVPATLLKASSRGRGPRPPEAAWMPKKVAVALAVILSDCRYADLAREIGLNKDTVASHCAAVRKAAFDDHALERQMDTMHAAAAVRLELTDRVGEAAPAHDHSTPRGRITALRMHMNGLFAQALRAFPTDEAPPSSVDFEPSSVDDGNVIVLGKQA